MKIKLARLCVIFFLVGAGSTWGAQQVLAAPRLSLDPIAASVSNGSTVQLHVTIDAESNQAFGSDAIISYPSSDLEVTGVTSGGFFSDFSWANDSGNNKLEIHGFFSTLYSGKSGSGTLATISFKAKKDSGTALASFVCGSGSTTRILDTSGTNILSCSSLNQSVLSFTGTQTQPTNTPIPTATPNPTATSAPSNNNINPVCEGLSVNRTSGTVPLTVTLTCTGSDKNNDVNFAEFSFGDNQEQHIEKNVGQYGSITTNHTYTIAGSFVASCRVRDNNAAFSSRPETCQKIITVSRGQQQATRTIASPTPTPIPTISTQIVTLSTVTPTPEETPSPTPIPKQAEGSQFPWGSIAIGGLLLGGLYFVWMWIVRNKNQQIPPPNMPSDLPPPPPVSS